MKRIEDMPTLGSRSNVVCNIEGWVSVITSQAMMTQFGTPMPQDNA